MGFDNSFHYLNLTLQVFFVDLLLSGDNAVVIALACRSLPPDLTKRAMLIGIDGAIALRILLATVATFLMHIPLLKLVGGVALTVIAIKLTIEEQGETKSGKSPPDNHPGLWSAVGTIIAADLVMSVDNVIALAAVAQGSIVILTMGLLMSVPLLIYGSLFVTALLRRYPLLKRAGGAMLGWLAGNIAISDPMIVQWVNQQSPALTVVVPILVVVFVLLESRIMEDARATAHALRPKLKPKAAIVHAPPAAAQATRVAATASEAAAAEVPSPPPEPAETLPSGDATSRIQAPRNKRVKRMVWIVAAILAAVLWIFFRSLSLDYATTTPPIQWTPPTAPR